MTNISSNVAAIDDYRWLTSQEAQPHLAAADDEPLLQIATRLRRELGAQRARLVTQLLELRRRARRKFPRAERMFFTPVGLEQATDHWIAAHKAARFNVDGRVADLCCGIGGDLLALAARGPTHGVDRDPVVAHLASANVACAGVYPAAAEVECRGVEAFDVGDFAAWHIDPDRRPDGKRTAAPDRGEPSAARIEDFRVVNPHAAIKLAPAAAVDEHWQREAELEWISRDRQCRQQVAWFGNLAQSPGSRVATRVATPDGQIARVVGQADEPLEIRGELAEYVFDCDPAVRAAHLRGAIARVLNLHSVDSQSTFLTGSRPVAHGLVDTFEVVAELPLDRRRLSAEFQHRGVGRLEIKSRDVEIDAEQFRRRLKLRGSHELTLILTRRLGKAIALLARRLAPDP